MKIVIDAQDRRVELEGDDVTADQALSVWKATREAERRAAYGFTAQRADEQVRPTNFRVREVRA